ncbi:MAG: immune inhibitor A [Candidatus Cloacimonetes bacterium]|nr:immune inhibitor A [Candidatus Cloacimonadota bacterium]
MNKNYVQIITLIVITAFSTLLIGKETFTLKQTTQDFTEIEFRLEDYEFITNEVDGVDYKRFYHPDAGILMEEGLPELPVFSATIAIPNTGTVYIEEIETLDSITYNDIKIYPSQGPDMFISPERGFLKDHDFYESNAQYPLKTSEISSPVIIRDFRFVTVSVTPFRYNPAQEKLLVDREIRIRINYDDTVVGENEITGPSRKLSRSFENIYRGMFLNYDDLRDPSWEYQARSILVVYHNSTALEPLVNQYVNWKRDKGFEITAVSTFGMGTADAIKAYIQNAYNTWENPPEYVLLIGGGTGSHQIPTFTAYSAQGDHPYGLLEGNDDIPDVFVGRLPIANATQLAVIWDKIRFYEREPFLGNTDWYRHTLLVGDTTTSSGISPKFVMKYIKELMEFESDQYQFTEHYSGNASNVINNAFNQGINFFPFRGYIGMAGWSPNADLLSNGSRMPNCFFITCATLNFDNQSKTETIVNMGTPGEPKGAVAAVGMTTASTRTTPNNALVGAFFYGIFNEGIRTMGETLARGKIFLHQTYGIVHPSLPPQHTQKASLMGDPSMDIWIDIPKTMNVSYEDTLPLGRNYLDVLVTDGEGLPIEDGWVTIRQDDDVIFATGYTNTNGEITHFFDPDNSGEVKVTVTKPDYLPHLGTFTLTGEWSVALNNVVVNDPFDAGSNVSMILTVKNFRDEIVNNVEGILTSNNPYVEIIEGISSFGNIAPGSIAESDDTFIVHVSYAAPNNMPVIFDLTLTDALENSWTSKFSLRVNGSQLIPTAILFGDNNHDYIPPGDAGMLRLTLHNTGEVDLSEVYGVIRTNNPLLDISDSLAYFGNIATGQSVTSAPTNSFMISALEDLIVGMTIEVELYLYNHLGFEAIQSKKLPVGLVTVTDPYGPCDYGYYIYGMEDVDYEYAPVYEWIEIAPQLGGPGSNTGLTSDWNNNQNVVTRNLPFTFRFYGVDYDEISICANGWISFGVTEQATFRNYILPGPLGPSPIVAAFWDNLSLSSGGVYFYETDDKYIVQWQNATVPSGTSPNTFQIILYNPELDETIDDGFIKIQYKVFNNVNSGTTGGDWSNYCTVGIGDHTSNVGLTYTFSNQYPTAAAPLSHESAIMIVGPRNYSEPFLIRDNIVVFDENNNGVIEVGENIKIGIYLKNIGYAPATNLTGILSTTSPFMSIVNDTSDYDDIESGMELVNQEFFEYNVSPNTPDGQTIQFVLNVVGDNTDTSFPFFLTVRRPSAYLSTYLVEEITGNGDGIIDPGETANLILQFTNPSLSTVNNANISVSTTNEYLTINNPNITIGDIPSNHNLQTAVNIDVDVNCPPDEKVSINIHFNANNVSNFTKELFLGISLEDIFNDFEANDGGFISNNTEGWQWGEPTIDAFSGSKVWGTVLDGNYADAASWTLDTPTFLITPTTSLSFYHYFNIENYWDGGNVKISTDDGDNWQIIYPEEGYSTNSINSGNSGIPNQPAYSGNSDGWQEAGFDLSQYFGQLANFRFHFGSGPWVNYLGWYIDDFFLSGMNQLTSVISGHVNLLRSPLAVDNVIITAGDYSVKPDLNGNYKLVVPAGNYLVTAHLPFHYEDTEYDVSLGELEFLTDYDFTLLYLTPPENLRYTLNEDNLTVDLLWDYEPLPDTSTRSGRDIPRDDDYYFTIYRQENSGYFTELTTTLELSYTDLIPNADNVYRYYIVTEYPYGSSDRSNIVATDSPYYDVDEDVPVVYEFRLRQNYPNPFNPVTNIAFTLPQQERVELKIFNIKGELVKTLINDTMDTGDHTVQWYGNNNQNRKVSSGIYFYSIQAGQYRDIKKAVLLK